MKSIKGLCVSKGDVRGIVSIIKEGQSLRGEHVSNTILVMKVLDSALLINLNKNIIGVIAESGNIGSHGAGILRQLGIPCVLRIKNATNILKNGDIVELRGSDNCIICDMSNEEEVDNEGSAVLGLRYITVAKHPFSIDK